jgi:hypothetical protein
MKRLLSYIYPVSIKVESEINGTLEITWFNGKKAFKHQKCQLFLWLFTANLKVWPGKNRPHKSTIRAASWSWWWICC